MSLSRPATRDGPPNTSSPFTRKPSFSRRASNPAIDILSPASPPDSFGRMLARSATAQIPPPTPVANAGFWQPSDAGVLHAQIVELANKRISTLDYLRKAYVLDSPG